MTQTSVVRDSDFVVDIQVISRVTNSDKVADFHPLPDREKTSIPLSLRVDLLFSTKFRLDVSETGLRTRILLTKKTSYTGTSLETRTGRRWRLGTGIRGTSRDPGSPGGPLRCDTRIVGDGTRLLPPRDVRRRVCESL